MISWQFFASNLQTLISSLDLPQALFLTIYWTFLLEVSSVHTLHIQIWPHLFALARTLQNIFLPICHYSHRPLDLQLWSHFGLPSLNAAVYSIVSATQLLLVLCLTHTCFVWPPRANQDQWVEVAGKPILPPYKEELLNTLSSQHKMGCLQKSWVLHTKGIWTEATWLIAGNAERTVLASDGVFTKWFYKASDSVEGSFVSPARLPEGRKTILPCCYISTALNSGAGHLVA